MVSLLILVDRIRVIGHVLLVRERVLRRGLRLMVIILRLSLLLVLILLVLRVVQLLVLILLRAGKRLRLSCVVFKCRCLGVPRWPGKVLFCIRPMMCLLMLLRLYLVGILRWLSGCRTRRWRLPTRFTCIRVLFLMGRSSLLILLVSVMSRLCIHQFRLIRRLVLRATVASRLIVHRLMSRFRLLCLMSVVVWLMFRRGILLSLWFRRKIPLMII